MFVLLFMGRIFVHDAGLNSPEAKSRFATLLAQPAASAPEQFGAFVKNERAKYEKVVNASGARMD
jgi:tripartite-type tricarboxylate transporter receptor subunit TctC